MSHLSSWSNEEEKLVMLEHNDNFMLEMVHFVSHGIGGKVWMGISGAITFLTFHKVITTIAHWKTMVHSSDGMAIQ